MLLPLEVFRRVAPLPGVAFLDGGTTFPRAPLSHLAYNPVRGLRMDAAGVVRVDGRRTSISDPVAALDGFLEQESVAGRTVIGALAYDLGPWIERASGPPYAHHPLPLVALHSYAEVHDFDARAGSWLAPIPELPPPPAGGLVVTRPEATLEPREYRRLFTRLQDWIAAGDVYQANLSFGFEARLRGSPALLYERLSARNPVPYGAYLDFGDFQILSNSPELFLQRRARRLVTRPIKGTRPRGRSRDEDVRLALDLARDPKERAEHVMIVDLERNDLGRLAEIGTVTVEEFAAVASYATLHHLESTISARLRGPVRFSDVLRASFPGGSITGAPKIRAIEILRELEPEPRGFFTGAILHHPPDGDFTLNIAIRTATVADGRVRYAAGGGVVADSDADREYGECMLKAAAFFSAAGHGARVVEWSCT